MLRKVSRVMIGSAGLLAFAAVGFSHFSDTSSVLATDTTNATFQINVKETLSVSVTAPSTWASDTPTFDSSTGTWSTGFLRNKISVNVISNNAQGFRASMYASNTSLVNTSKSSATLPTLDTSIYPSGVERSAFPANSWGYSLTDTDSGLDSSSYLAMGSSSSPVTLISESGAAAGSKDVYFGAKANLSQASGTYAGTVTISVVTGDIVEPTTPATPNAAPNVAVYNPSPVGGSANGSTAYTTFSGTTTTTQVSDGDNRAYSGYVSPQGVKDNTTSDIANGSSIATALAVAASIAAVSGVAFFAVAKRRNEDDEEE
ncbi:hypothetical protein IJF93_01285 [Candidatus Saccharibacteria bacterium]|nr:hypothetical protein [Candidatus Saccharibacteria bacterium]